MTASKLSILLAVVALVGCGKKEDPAYPQKTFREIIKENTEPSAKYVDDGRGNCFTIVYPNGTVNPGQVIKSECK